MFQLKRYFSLASLAAFIVSLFVLGTFYRWIAVRSMVAMAEQHNVALTQAFSNSLWEEYSEFVTQVAGQDGDMIRERPETRDLLLAVTQQMANTNVVKVNIFDVDALTVFSTDQSKIGEYKVETGGYLLARTGETASAMVSQEHFNSWESDVDGRNIVSSYVPIRPVSTSNDAPQVEGVFEIYTDVTSIVDEINRTQAYILLGIGSLMALLYLCMYAIVHRADAIIKRQTLELTEKNVSLTNLIEEKEELLNIAAHDLRSPLTAIGLTADALSFADSNIKPDVRRKRLRTLKKSVDSMLTIVNSILETGRIEKGILELNMGSVMLMPLLDATIAQQELQARAKAITIKLNQQEYGLQVNADANLLQQVFTNLLTNAIKFSPAGTVVLVSVSAETQHVKIAFLDQGLGLNHEDQSRIFGKFARLSAKPTSGESSTGLGLFIVKKWVDAMGGTISAESPGIGRGSKFTITLPRSYKIVKRQSEGVLPIPHDSISNNTPLS